jgi:hypothetical protein
MTKRNPLYKKIQRIAFYMMQAAQMGGKLKSWQRPCADCGTWDAWAWIDEHRDYSDPYDIVCVCAPCNQKRGPADLWLFNVETAEWQSVLPWTSYVKYTAKVNARHWTLKKMLRRGMISKANLLCMPIHL